MKKITRHKFAFVLTLLITLILIGSSGFLIYNIYLLKNIENTIRLISVIAICLISLIFIILLFRYLKKYKRLKLFFIILLTLAFVTGETFISYNIMKVYGSIDKVSKTVKYTTYSSSLVTLSGNKAESLDDVDKSEKLGILKDKTSYEGNIIPKEVIKKKDLENETQTYTSFIAMLDALKKGEINYVFVPTNYTIMYGSIDGYEDLNTTTKIIYTQKKKVKKDSIKKASTKPITEPFTLLLMGVDSEEEGIANSSFNGDSLMVLTFNPKTLNTTILSIPRDSYVPIACFANQRKNKITHAAWQGEECMQKTIENLLDVDIDYYVKINFKGVVKLVDTLGGVKIDVPYNLCEQNSNRQWGDKTVYIEKGLQNLDGEKALAYSRNRHPNPDMCSAKWTNYDSNDFVRGQHQQEVVRALLNKVKNIKDLNQIYDLLDTISTNMNTNMSSEQILSLYNVFKDISKKASKNTNMDQLLGFQRLYLNGYSQMIYDYGGTNLTLYNYVLYDDSVKAVSNAMKVNLGKKTQKKIKKFSFDINNPYEEEVIGQKEASKTSLVLLPSFIGSTVSYANSFCSANGINVNVKGGSGGSVISQSVPAGANVEDVRSISLTTSSAVTSNNTTEKKTQTDTVIATEEEPTKETEDTTTGGNSSGGATGESGGQTPKESTTQPSENTNNTTNP